MYMYIIDELTQLIPNWIDVILCQRDDIIDNTSYIDSR